MTRDEIENEYQSLRTKRDAIAHTMGTAGWAHICEWHRKQREASVSGLARQVLARDDNAMATAALLEVSEELEHREQNLLVEIENQLRSLREAFVALAPVDLSLVNQYRKG